MHVCHRTTLPPDERRYNRWTLIVTHVLLLSASPQVVCCVGARETLDIGAPKRIDGDGTTALVNAAADAGVQQFVLVSSLGTGKVGSWLANLVG